jgi:hypothetical protein
MLVQFLQTISTIQPVEMNEGPLFPAPKLRQRKAKRCELSRFFESNPWGFS